MGQAAGIPGLQEEIHHHHGIHPPTYGKQNVIFFPAEVLFFQVVCEVVQHTNKIQKKRVPLRGTLLI
jgi:hypothetical protein